MILIRHESHTGETIDILPERFQPLSYVDLVSDYKRPGKQYPMEIDAKSVESSRLTWEPKGPARVSMPMKFRQPLSVFALVAGGWLPPPFVIPANFLVDRNVVATLAKIRRGVSRSDVTQGDWWFQFFSQFSALINPVPYAFEGKNQSPPSFEEFRRAFDEASLEVSNQLPGARLVKYQLVHFRAADALITQFADRLQRETEFLIKTVPIVLHRVAASQLTKARSEVLNTAKQLKLKTHSLAALAVLSCLYERIDGSGFLAARRLLKPSATYTRQNAYNALSDLRAIEMFTSGLGFEREPFALCTCDRAIAAFWCGLNVHDSRWENEQSSFTISLTEELFPRLEEAEREELAGELYS